MIVFIIIIKKNNEVTMWEELKTFIEVVEQQALLKRRRN